MFAILLTLFLLILPFGCSQEKIARENYVQAMTELGCKLTIEGSAGAEEIYKKFGITQEKIQDFRKNSNSNEMMEIAQQIAKNVAACHGVRH